MLSLVAAATICGPELADAQGSAPADSRLRVFIDCSVSGCDSDFFRTEIPFVDHVRDRADADVHVLVASQPNGGGGKTYTLTFIPRQGRVRTDSLTFTTPQSATEDDKRRAITRVMKLGLVPFVAHLPGENRLDVSLIPDKKGAAAPAPFKKDPWNLWVFRIGGNSNFGGEKSQHYAFLYGSTSARRTTKDWKVAVVANGSYNENKYTFSNDAKFANYSHSYGVSQTVVKAVSSHFSVGEKTLFAASTYLNQKVNVRMAPAVEYNLFDYAEATRRQFTLQYSPGFSHFRYIEKTVYGKISETHPNHSLTAALDLKQPWGSVSTSLEGASLLDDVSKNHLVSYTNLSVRLFKGLNFNMYSSVSLIRDQLHLPAANLTDEEILTRQRQLATSYSYFGGIGLSYTFGSVLNNIVNPRFSGSSGGFISVE